MRTITDAGRHPALPMSCEEVRATVGQMLVVGFHGTCADDRGVGELGRQAQAGEVGGALFFRHNIRSPEQLRHLLAHMKGWQCPQPFLTFVDQEGGRVQRLTPAQGFAGCPSAAAVGAGSPDEARAHAAGLAEELRDMGFAVNLAPVVDLMFENSPAIGAHGRSFGACVPDVVARAGVYLDAHAERRLGTALKHFPGHGSARADTHLLGMADVSDSHQPGELEPFRRLIADGRADLVMTSHLVHRALAPGGEPVTLSRPAVYGILRDRFGFTGPIISDDLCMGALRGAAGGLEAVIAGACGAGHDLLVVSSFAAQGPPTAAGGPPTTGDGLCTFATTAVIRGIKAGIVAEADLRASAERVRRFKDRFATPMVRAPAAA